MSYNIQNGYEAPHNNYTLLIRKLYYSHRKKSSKRVNKTSYLLIWERATVRSDSVYNQQENKTNVNAM